jgi:hypothetical protein
MAVVLLTASKDQPAAAKNEAYGFRFLYQGKLSPKEYLQKHPCVSGGWRFKEETDSHWVGELNYPTGNVPPTYPSRNEAAFVVRPIKIEKQKDLPVNLKTWQGMVILLQADGAVRFGTPRSLASAFKLIAVETATGKATTFLFHKYKDLAFSR